MDTSHLIGKYDVLRFLLMIRRKQAHDFVDGMLELLPLLPLPLVLEKEIRRFTRLVLYKERQLGEALAVLLKICLEHNYVPLPFDHPEPRLRGDVNVLKHFDAGWHR